MPFFIQKSRHRHTAAEKQQLIFGQSVPIYPSGLSFDKALPAMGELYISMSNVVWGKLTQQRLQGYYGGERGELPSDYLSKSL